MLLRPDSVILVSCLRNEELRLPFFLDYYRALGVAHFFFIDNESDDSTLSLLAGQRDVTVFSAKGSYREARFGMDWVNHILSKYCHNRWCVVVDCDELLVYAGAASLPELAARLDARNERLFGATMVELYPNSRIESRPYHAGENPLEILNYFDPDGYSTRRQWPMGNLWVQGGPRRRRFFQDDPDRAPTLNKFPFLKWHWRWAYVNSTHALLPYWLNYAYDGPSSNQPCCALLHTKFLSDAGQRAQIEAQRGEHFGDPSRFSDYYAALGKNPNFWYSSARRYSGPEDLVDSGLMSNADW